MACEQNCPSGAQARGILRHFRTRFRPWPFKTGVSPAPRDCGTAGAKRDWLPAWAKATQALLLAVAVCFSMGASNDGARVVSLDHELMCTCGCAELLGECNHVGCTESTEELAMLRSDVAAGMTDGQIFNAFSAKYGQTVLAAPKTRGFDLVAWIAPFAVFAAALLGTILLIRRWGGLGLERAQRATAPDIGALPAEERERRERIRRETGDQGGD